ncbi:MULTISPECIES: HAD family hydrolase [Prochlorococcus]|uniref:HAD family hydrolase n=1 Tax=Prochlorococcus TaxID=1218 RepID=UPI0005339B2A|nr:MULTISPECIES: HAD hydrolase-like protein [Prochlorococcus]KGG12033.1 putative haloacid dehalogenase-like hydrolase family protein [Prochlorococcus sp. MIT 0601]
MLLDRYRSIVFDCDGVLLNSNFIKTDCFRKALQPYGKESIDRLIDYHQLNGGVSRYKKFDYFLSVIAPKYSSLKNGPNLEELVDIYSKECKKYLFKAEVASKLGLLREFTKDKSWFIVSGGAEEELREIFVANKLFKLFDGGIYGSPDTKNKILTREISKGTLNLPALFLGDSRLDHQVALENGLDFIFISNWTDFKDYKSYCINNSIPIIGQVSELLNSLPL